MVLAEDRGLSVEAYRREPFNGLEVGQFGTAEMRPARFEGDHSIVSYKRISSR